MTDSRALKIGDVVPLAVPIDDRVRRELNGVRCRRGQIERAAASGRSNGNVSQARLILAGRRDRDDRLADPVEQAKTFLRRQGINTYAGTVLGHDEGTVVVGTKLRTIADMMALAVRLGWGGAGGCIAPPLGANDAGPAIALTLAERVERFLKRSGMSPGAFGRAAYGHSYFVRQMRAGQKSRPASVAKVEAWLDRAEAEL